MLAEIGFVALVGSLLVALYGIVISIYGERFARSEALVRSGRNAVFVTAGLLTVSTGALLVALLAQDYQITYVWSVSSPDMDLLYRSTALWGSQAGSMLFWSFLMSLFAAGTMMLNWRSNRRLMPYAGAVMLAVIAFFVALNVFLENPFERWWVMPDLPAEEQVVRSVFAPSGSVSPELHVLAQSAQGLSPMLRHFGMAIHPPLLYLGFVGFIIPFAFALSALASGDLSPNWIKASRRWTLAAWLFLSLGLILGGRWAYDVLGWGGYWGWDPVENAAFLPWLIGTAYLHSVMIQEKRGMLKLWNMFLIVATFSAVIFGTFATRSGLVDSVHSFARSAIGFPMFGFWFTMTLTAVILIVWRNWRGELRDDHPFKGIFTREGLFVLNNFVFVALFIAIFWGSFGAPIISELLMNTNITLGADYFMQVTPPLFVVMYILMGVAPISAWGTASLSRMGRLLLIPFILTIIGVALFYVGGMQSIGALFGYGVVLLAGNVAIVETVRGVMARQRVHNENVLQSLNSLLTRNPRRYGGYLIHLGITVIGIGVIGSTLFQAETQRTLAVGETLEFNGYVMRYDSIDTGVVSPDGNVVSDIATVTVFRDGALLAQLQPKRESFPNTGEGLTTAGAHSTFENDFYVLLVNWEPVNANQATFKVYINPLINLVWWGSVILIFGVLAASIPSSVLPERVREELRGTKLAVKGA